LLVILLNYKRLFKLVILLNRFVRLLGNLIKFIGLIFHFFFPNLRFEIPSYSKNKFDRPRTQKIPRTIWQTNFSNRSTLPVYINYLFNRLMSLSYEYRYVSTEERFLYIQKNADERVFNAFSLLTDGAAQADLWRMIVLYNEGGIYMDIDACLIRPLSSVIDTNDDAVYLWLDKNQEFTNFFIASAPRSTVLKNTIECIVLNIENRHISEGVYGMTGPKVFSKHIEKSKVKFFERKYLCIQGAFTNEYFQYMDKPRTKWIYKSKEDLLK